MGYCCQNVSVGQSWEVTTNLAAKKRLSGTSLPLAVSSRKRRESLQYILTQSLLVLWTKRNGLLKVWPLGRGAGNEQKYFKQQELRQKYAGQPSRTQQDNQGHCKAKWTLQGTSGHVGQTKGSESGSLVCLGIKICGKIENGSVTGLGPGQ